MISSKSEKQILSKLEGIGSREHDFLAILVINLLSSTAVVSLNWLFVKQLDIASCIWPEAKPLENFKQLKMAKNITHDLLNILFSFLLKNWQMIQIFNQHRGRTA